MIVFSVLYLTTPSSPTGTSYSLSSVISTTSLSSKISDSSLTTTRTTRKCTTLTASELLPFFEQESPQVNLPRRISSSERDNLLDRLPSLRLTLVACVHNIQ